MLRVLRLTICLTPQLTVDSNCISLTEPYCSIVQLNFECQRKMDTIYLGWEEHTTLILALEDHLILHWKPVCQIMALHKDIMRINEFWKITVTFVLCLLPLCIVLSFWSPDSVQLTVSYRQWFQMLQHFNYGCGISMRFTGSEYNILYNVIFWRPSVSF